MKQTEQDKFQKTDRITPGGKKGKKKTRVGGQQLMQSWYIGDLEDGADRARTIMPFRTKNFSHPKQEKSVGGYW